MYGGPDTIAGWFPATRTNVQLSSGYKTVAGYDDLLFMLQGPVLYKYRPGGAPIVLRSDLDPKISQQVVDEDVNFIFISDPVGGGNWDGDAVVVVDSSGWIRYRFAFDPPLNTYNVTSLFMVNDSLFFISGSLNQAFGRALVHIKLDYDTYTATPVWIASAGDLTHLFSCSPGRLVAGCAPNVEIGPGTTSILAGGVVKNAFSLYPNPARDDMYIVGDQLLSKSFEIHGSDGRFVKRGVLDHSPARIDVADLGPGLYVLRITGADSGRFLKIE